MTLIWTGPLTKPSRLAPLERKLKRRQKVLRKKLQAKREQWDRDAAIRAATFGRDKGRCRACGQVVYLRHSSPLKVAHAHHVQYRSAGGRTALHNLVTLCPTDHDFEHRGLLKIEGSPNETLTLTRYDSKGNVLCMLESALP